jgi:AraC family transcriptional regulator of adaptative response/methylated-DNA-[protein]-cysteine methyltransferase
MRIEDSHQIEAMQMAFARRDRSADGRFVCAVATTRIYCRPSCPARRPLPQNVVFFTSGEAARAAGYRPCRRCLPDDAARDESAVAQAIAALAGAEGLLRLGELARITSYSSTHLQRIFKRRTGLSPAAYGRESRAGRAVEALAEGGPVGDAIYKAGYSGPSRFYEAMPGRLGMVPSAWINGGRGVTIRWAVAETSLGPILLAATARGVCRLSFGEGREALEARFPNAVLEEGGEGFADLLRAVVTAVEHPGDSSGPIPLDVKGTPFQEAVWRALRQIPPGETRSYAEIAAAAGRPRAVRAAGSANGANPVAVLVPCHRVVRADGSLGGYAWGEDIKRALLDKEASLPE